MVLGCEKLKGRTAPDTNAQNVNGCHGGRWGDYESEKRLIEVVRKMIALVFLVICFLASLNFAIAVSIVQEGNAVWWAMPNGAAALFIFGIGLKILIEG